MFFRVIRIYFFLSLVALLGLLIVVIIFPFTTQKGRQKLTKIWSRSVLVVLGVKVEIYGAVPSGSHPMLLVSNHVSWVDIQAIHSAIFIRFVAKTDVRRWPLIGYLSARVGTVFINRNSKRAVIEANALLGDLYQQGESVYLFPEGTTSSGKTVLPFSQSLFQSAIDHDILIQPIALKYVDENGDLHQGISFEGDISLLGSIHRIARSDNATLRLHFLAPIISKDKSRKQVSLEAHDLITNALQSQP